jgi:hypothetical protein
MLQAGRTLTEWKVEILPTVYLQCDKNGALIRDYHDYTSGNVSKSKLLGPLKISKARIKTLVDPRVISFLKMRLAILRKNKNEASQEIVLQLPKRIALFDQ